MAKTYDELLEAVLEAAMPVDDDYDEDLMEEGANSQLRDIKKQAKSLKKINIKGMKRMYKSGNYAGAKQAGLDILAAIEDYEKKFKEVDQSFGSSVLGDLMGGALRLIKDLATGFLTFGIAPFISFSKRILSHIVQVQKAAGDKDVDYKMFNSYASDILTMLDDMKHRVKQIIVKCDEGLRATGGASTPNSAVTEAYTEFIQDEYLELMTEGFLSNPLKNHIEKLKDIKSKKPAEYDGPEEVKKFVDENFKDIEKAADLLEREPEDLRANQIKYLVTTLVTWIGWLAVGCAFEAISAVGVVLVSIITLAVLIVPVIIDYCRRANDVKAMDELTKIKNALKKVKTDKLPDSMKKKVSDLITKIDDAETEIRATMKLSKESADDVDFQLTIYESAYAGEITEEQRDSLLSAFCEDTSQNAGGGSNN